VLVDPHCYPTWRAQVRELRAMVRRQGASAILRSAARASVRHLRGRYVQKREPSGGREPPPVQAFRVHLQALVKRGVEVLVIYSGIHGAQYNDADQLFELFPELRGKVECAYFPDANHTFTELDAQSQLIAAVATWITARFR
jgi:hypothetical protein